MTQPDDFLKEIGMRVKMKRHEKRLSLQALGDAAGVSHVTILRIEAGSAASKISVLADVASALGMGLDDLLAPRPPPTDDAKDADLLNRLGRALHGLERQDAEELVGLFEDGAAARRTPQGQQGGAKRPGKAE